MIRSYSVAEARNRFAEILHDLKNVARVEVTRRGRPVAVLISIAEYEALCGGKTDFGTAYDAFRRQYDLESAGIEPEVFANVRDAAAGREMSW